MSKQSDVVQIYNRSKQTIPLQVRPPGGDFFLHEQAIQLGPGKTVTLPKTYTNEAQINNLQRRQQIQVIFDSETAAVQ